MQKRTYVCNLCKNESGRPGTVYPDDIIGFEFHGTHKFRQRPAPEVEMHLCRHCLDAMTELANTIEWRTTKVEA